MARDELLSDVARSRVELIVHESANCRTLCCHRRGRTAQTLCVVNQFMLEFLVCIIQELTVVLRPVYILDSLSGTPTRSMFEVGNAPDRLSQRECNRESFAARPYGSMSPNGRNAQAEACVQGRLSN
jgi:hypothetical protein